MCCTVDVIGKPYLLYLQSVLRLLHQSGVHVVSVSFISLWCMWCLPASSAVLLEGLRAVQYDTRVHNII